MIVLGHNLCHLSLIHIIRNICGLFISIQNNKIYLIHQTAKEIFLVKGDARARYEWKSSFDIASSNTVLAQCMHSLPLFNGFWVC